MKNDLGYYKMLGLTILYYSLSVLVLILAYLGIKDLLLY